MTASMLFTESNVYHYFYTAYHILWDAGIGKDWKELAYKNYPYYANQTVPGCDSNLRPDIAVIDDKNRIATIIDVAIPFESSYSAFEDTRRRKKEKYADIIKRMYRKRTI
uniref:Predicted amidohydrolase n=1 Tax=Panagrellus redivivus TaxID=6233 RepID=A0A7E4W1Q3_PANRE